LKSVAGLEFARLSTGAPITRGNSGNGVLLTRENRAGREQKSRNGKGVPCGAEHRKDHRGVDLISDPLPFGRLWYGEPNAVSNAIDYAKFYSRSHDALIRVYDALGKGFETHEHAGDFRKP